MNVKIKREELIKKLSDIQYIVEKKGSMAVLNHFLLKALRDMPFIMATDLETALKEPIEMEIMEEGSFCIPGKKLLEIAKEMDEDIIIQSVDEGWVKVKSGRTSFRITCLKSDDFPLWPSVEATKKVTLPKETIRLMIDKTLYAAGENDTRYVLNSLLFHFKTTGRLTVVGTDGHRLAMAETEVNFTPEEDIKLIISRKSVAEIKRACAAEGDIDLFIEKNYILFKTEDIELLNRLIEGSYPNYENVIPFSNDITVSVNKDDFVKALRRASIISKERTSLVMFDIEASNMVITASNPEVGESRDEIAVELKGEPLKIAFNARLLLDSINVFDSQKVVIKINEPLSPVMIKSDTDDNSLSVLMPMRM